MALEPGDLAPPDLTFVDAEGEETPLSAFHGEAAVLIFLRHLG